MTPSLRPLLRALLRALLKASKGPLLGPLGPLLAPLLRTLAVSLTVGCPGVIGTLPVPDAPRPPPAPSPAPSPTRARALSDLLPDETVAAVELRDLARRWPEVRALPRVAAVQDSLLETVGLDPASLPLVAGDRAILALVAEAGGPALPVALLRPSHPAEAMAVLDGVRIAGERLAVVRRDGAIWVGPAGTAGRLGELARGRRGGAAWRGELAELDRRLPAGGLARGWIDPGGLAELLRDRPPGTEPFAVEALVGAVAAELDLMRFAGFRRDLAGTSIETEAVVTYNPAELPAEIAEVLSDSRPSALPAAIPPGVVAVLAFRPEAAASLAWMRRAALGDPRGPLRNLDFWLDELEDGSGVDLERDLAGSLGERGWLFVLKGDTRGTARLAVVVEAADERRLERALVGARSWLIDRAWGRTLGLAVPRAQEGAIGESAVHGLSLWTPFGETPGPAFAVTGGHLVAGTDEPALRQGLRLLSDERGWRPVSAGAGAPDESLLVDGTALASLVAGMVAAAPPERRSPVTSAVGELLSDLDTARLGVWFEGDALRFRGRIRLRGAAGAVEYGPPGGAEREQGRSVLPPPVLNELRAHP